MNPRSLKYILTLATLLAVSSALPAFAQDEAAQDGILDVEPNNAIAADVVESAPSASAAELSDDDKALNISNDDPTIEEIQAAAQPPKLESNIFDSGQIVRRKLLYRSTRFEAVPFFGLTVNDGFNRNLMPGINLNYHLTNDLGISATFAYGVYQWETSLKKNYVKTLKTLGKTGNDALKATDFMKLQFFADLGLSYVPFFGKFSFFGAGTVAWDFHLVGGVALMKQDVYNVVGTPSANSVLSGIRPGGVLQLGLRFFLNDFMSLNLDVRNLIYASSDFTVNNDNTNATISDRVFVSLGLGFFFPTDIKVSW